MAGHKIDKLSLKKYFELHREQITAVENWQHKTDEIVFGVHSIAPTIPLLAIRKAFVREKKNWLEVDKEVFSKLFVEE